MKMNLFEPLRLKFEKSNWASNPEFGLIDTILENHPELYGYVQADIIKGGKVSDFGRKDVPSIERIVRAAIYKELRRLDYRELEYHQEDSRICDQFLKIDGGRRYSFQMYQKYISKIQADSLDELLVALNKIAIGEGLEDINQLRQDSTVIKADIHYPTNNSLVWDCIRESHRLLSKLDEEVKCVSYRDYLKSAKKTYFKINNTKGPKSKERREVLFQKQLITFTKCINQVSNAIKKKQYCRSVIAIGLIIALEDLLPVMEQVYDMTERREIRQESVPNEDKIFSIYERHTDIIVKGSRDVQFGHKVNLTTGRSNLILSCEVLTGNPSDSILYKSTLDKVMSDYNVVPRDSVTDGGYASKDNQAYAMEKGIRNVVFNKIVGSLKNVTSSLSMETRLKKWRSGIEANISNFKRGFDMFRCTWKGERHFKSKVLWSAIAYNIRTMTAIVLEQFKPPSVTH
ncbi:MAG: ISNCY family transposase [Candidatus Saccharimonadales bacterium]